MSADDLEAVQALQVAVVQANMAAQGNSNDTEIERLTEALDLALARWPEVTRDALAVVKVEHLHPGHDAVAPGADSGARVLEHPVQGPSGRYWVNLSGQMCGPYAAGTLIEIIPGDDYFTNTDDIDD